MKIRDANRVFTFRSFPIETAITNTFIIAVDAEMAQPKTRRLCPMENTDGRSTGFEGIPPMRVLFEKPSTVIHHFASCKKSMIFLEEVLREISVGNALEPRFDRCTLPD